MKKLFTLLLVLALCLSMAVGCGKTEDPTETEESTPEAEVVQPENPDPVMGKVTYIDESYLVVQIYDNDLGITDLVALDGSLLTQTIDEEYVYLYDDGVYQAVRDGALVEASLEDVTEGTMIAVMYDAQGQQQITILPVTEEEPETADRVLVALVTAVNEDGTLELEEYEAVGEEAISDYADVDLSGYASSQIQQTYTIAEGTQVIYAEEGTQMEVDTSWIEAGDMLVIVTDTEGVDTIYLYFAVMEE